MSDVLVEAVGLVKRYPPRDRHSAPFVAVDGIDFALRRGEAFGFLGPNGAGKSSTMRMIACVSAPTGGLLRVLGMDPATDGRRIRAHLGVVPQDDALDRELSVRENLLIYGRYFGLPKAVIAERSARLLDFAQLTERGHEGVDALSGGMRRRLTIARSLINATSAMNSAVGETTGGFWWRARFERFYDAMVTTPMRVTDIAVGETAASVLRATLSSVCFLAVIAALGLVRSWWAVLALPALVLVAFAFSAAGILVATLMRDMHHTQYLQLGMLPMFLFATTFFPLSVYPGWLQPVVAVLPLYQAIELIRGLTTGVLGAGLLWAVGYLLALGGVSLWLAQRRLARLLLT